MKDGYRLIPLGTKRFGNIQTRGPKISSIKTAVESSSKKPELDDDKPKTERSTE